MKTFTGQLQIKSAPRGEIECVFSTLEVVDFQGDWVKTGAFGRQNVLIRPWNHDMSGPPIGEGVITEENGRGVMRGKIFLDMVSGRDHFVALQRLPDVQWSYQFDVLKNSFKRIDGKDVQVLEQLKVYSVDPVDRAASLGTETLSVKSARSDVRSMRAQIDALDSKARGSRSPTIGSPGQARAAIDGMTLDGVISDLQSRIDAPRTTPAPGLIGLWRSTLRAEGHSPNWIEQVICAEIYGLAEIIRAHDPLLFPNPEAALREAHRQLSRPLGPGNVQWFPQVGS